MKNVLIMHMHKLERGRQHTMSIVSSFWRAGRFTWTSERAFGVI